MKDKQSAVIPNAQVILLDQENAGQRKQPSGIEGGFMFTSLPPSTYTVIIETPGLRKWEKNDIRLHANDHIGVSDSVLKRGSVSETTMVVPWNSPTR